MNSDLRHFLKMECFDNRDMNFLQKFQRIMFIPQYRSVYLIRKMQFTKNKRVKRFYCNCLIREFGIYCGFNATIEIGLKLPHPQGIVIGNNVSIGKNVTIYQQVTIGSANLGDWKYGDRQPNIESGVILFAGSKIIGNILVSENTVVGANSVLNKSTNRNSIWAGIPAKKIK